MKGALILMACLASCVNPGNKSSKLSSNLIQRITVGETDMTVRYLPDYSRVASGINSAFVYFRVLIEKQKDHSLSREKLLYLNFDIQNDFLLTSGQDSILPAICQKIENGRSGTAEYILAFEQFGKGDLKRPGSTIIYKDKIFSIGTLAFAFPHMNIAQASDPFSNSQP